MWPALEGHLPGRFRSVITKAGGIVWSKPIALRVL